MREAAQKKPRTKVLKFSEEEDRQLLALVARIGLNWKQIGQSMRVVRSEFQIKNRYYRKVKPLLRQQREQQQSALPPEPPLYNIDQYLSQSLSPLPPGPALPCPEPNPQDGFFNSQILNLNLKISQMQSLVGSLKSRLSQLVEGPEGESFLTNL